MADKHARPQLGQVTDLHVHESGTPGSSAIVFLHGVGNSGGMWASHMARLTGCHCLAPDLPGFGRSNRVPWRSRIHTAELVADLIEHRVPARRAHVVGLSLGGSVTHTLLARRPELLDRVVIDGCGALPWRGTGLLKLAVAAVSPLLHTRPRESSRSAVPPAWTTPPCCPPAPSRTRPGSAPCPNRSGPSRCGIRCGTTTPSPTRWAAARSPPPSPSTAPR